MSALWDGPVCWDQPHKIIDSTGREALTEKTTLDERFRETLEDCQGSFSFADSLVPEGPSKGPISRIEDWAVKDCYARDWAPRCHRKHVQGGGSGDCVMSLRLSEGGSPKATFSQVDMQPNFQGFGREGP